jgi:hypothetical protein
MMQRKKAQLERKSKPWSLSSILLIALCLLMNNQASATAQNGFEQKVELKASNLLSPDLLKSDLYTVDEEVINDGMCERNNRLVVKAVENLTAAMKENTEVVSKMGDQIHTLKVDVAVLKDRRQAGRRSDEEKEEHDTDN